MRKMSMTNIIQVVRELLLRRCTSAVRSGHPPNSG